VPDDVEVWYWIPPSKLFMKIIFATNDNTLKSSLLVRSWKRTGNEINNLTKLLARFNCFEVSSRTSHGPNSRTNSDWVCEVGESKKLENRFDTAALKPTWTKQTADKQSLSVSGCSQVGKHSFWRVIKMIWKRIHHESSKQPTASGNSRGTLPLESKQSYPIIRLSHS